MSKIHQLPPYLVAKIAAGEVIERPIYAVKELIENSIDAKADEITIHIEDGGLKKIMVTDNGEGMGEEDLKMCCKSHTTSKTALDDTLIGIKSLGFRGEALASLSAVSYLTIKSRKKNESIGNQIDVKNGNVLNVTPCGMPQGTVVIAENLFSEIPARKKFLKTNQTEFRHIADIVSQYALAYSTIHFVLTHNKRRVFDFPKNHMNGERIQSILGKHMSNFLLPIKYNESYVSIRGYLAKPQLHSASSSKQFLFVNNRRVTDRLISLAVKEAYSTMLESSSFPIFALFLTLPYEMVDVNIHPRKEHIGIINNQIVFQIVKQAVLTTLQENNITFQNLSWKKTGIGTTQSFAGKLLKKTILDKEIFKTPASTSITQLHALYILYETKNGLVFIDQHGAHERILFEKLLKVFLKQKKKQKSYQLPEPVALHLSPSEHLLLTEYIKLFKKLGFELTAVNNKVLGTKNLNDPLILTHVPFLFQDRDHKKFIQHLLERIEDDLPIKQVDAISEEMLAFLACRAAVKAGDTLTINQMKKIIEDLEKTPNNATCPHGRPTHIFTSLSELNSNFKR